MRGRQQALLLAQRLESVPIARIYTSPVLRAIETSVLIAQHLGLEYEVTSALREYDCGVLEGRSDEKAWQAWRELFYAWTKDEKFEERIEGGESYLDIRARFEPFIENLIRMYAESNTDILCVGHGGLYSMMLPLLLKNLDFRFVSQHGLDYTAWIVAEYHPDGFYCLEWNGRSFEKMLKE